MEAGHETQLAAIDCESNAAFERILTILEDAESVENLHDVPQEIGEPRSQMDTLRDRFDSLHASGTDTTYVRRNGRLLVNNRIWSVTRIPKDFNTG